MKQIMYLPIESIVKEKSAFRSLNTEEMEELKESISRVGILQPLVVTKKSDGEYALCAGYNRLEAARQSGISEVPVVVLECLEEIIDAKYDTDLYRRHLTIEEKKNYKDEKMNLMESLFTNSLIPELLEQYKIGGLSYAEAKILSSLSMERQREILFVVESGNANKEIKRYEEKMRDYEEQIAALEEQINRFHETQSDNEMNLKKIELMFKKRMEEEREKIRAEYEEEFRQGKKDIEKYLEEKKMEVVKEYEKEIELLRKDLIDMSKAKSNAQKQIDEVKALLEKTIKEKKEIEILATKGKNEAIFMRETLRKITDTDTLLRRFDNAITEIQKACDTMVIAGYDMVKQYIPEINKRMITISDKLQELKDYFKNEGR